MPLQMPDSTQVTPIVVPDYTWKLSVCLNTVMFQLVGGMRLAELEKGVDAALV